MKRFALLIITLFILTGCHEDGYTFHWITPEAPQVAIDSPEIIPAEEVGELEPDPTPQPPCIVIKSNVSKSGEKIYHMPGQANYENVKIDESKGEAFHCSEEEAIAAGFRKALR